MLTLELGDGIVVELPLVAVTFAQGLPHPDQCLVTERDPFQQAREPLLQHLFARIRLRVLGPVKNSAISAGVGRSQSTSRVPSAGTR